jgi:uncharacterized repeat protein (TIGR03803 family)
MSAPRAWADAEKTLYNFTYRNQAGGDNPLAGLIFDQAGNLYGTTVEKGVNYWGVVFKLAPNGDGTWTESVLYSFRDGSDGAYPWAGLIFDQAGNLYGTTSWGGDSSCTYGYGYGCGVVFKLAPNSDGSWTESVLYTFTGGADGAVPAAGLIFDQSGNLYGTASAGGAQGDGVVFELTPNADGTWTENVLHAFAGGKDGVGPVAGLILDQAGNLYGTTSGGGIIKCGGSGSGCGTVFKLAPNADGSWTETVLHAFAGGKDGVGPLAGLIFDQAGNLYSTASSGGAYGDGIAFQLKPTSGGKRWKETVMHTFAGGKDGAGPLAALVFDASGNLYGTTEYGGHAWCPGGSKNIGCGVAFELKPTSGGKRWKEHVVHAFLKHEGWPVDSLVLDSSGNLYGTTQGTGRSILDGGTVFEITP